MNWQGRLDGSPDPPTLGDILRIRAGTHPHHVAMRFEGRDTTYSEMLGQAVRVSNALRSLELNPGQRIGLLGKNSDSFFTTLIGAAMAGIVLVPINWRLSPPEVAYILEDAQIGVVLVEDELRDLAVSAGEGGPVRRLISLGSGPDSLAALLSAASAEDDALPVSPGDVALQLYTSGTTGKPKGALLTHHSLSSVRVSQREDMDWCRWDDDDVCLISMPLFHIGGIGTALASLYHGATMVIAREFAPSDLFDYIALHRITRLFIVPTALGMLLDHPKAATTDFGSLRFVMFGASPITQDLLSKALKLFGCPFVQVYGMTETSGTIAGISSEEAVDAPHRLRAAGRPLQGVELAILDPEGRRLPPNSSGEVAIRSSANMAGYWRLPEATAASHTPDGFLLSGDAGYLDEDGYLYIQDRIKDMIITGGENVYPLEVEGVLSNHPAIHEVAVVGAPDPKWGEAVKAVVVLEPGASLDAEELRRWARGRLADYKIPKQLAVVPRLPRNASGKVLKRELRDPNPG